MNISNINLKSALCQWSQHRRVRPIDFAQTMGYSPAYAWSLLRGDAAVTVSCLGQFLLSYGTEATSELLAIAKEMQPNQIHTL